MKNLLDYRLVILTNDNCIKPYAIEIGKGHDECLNEFSKEYGYSSHSSEFLTCKGHSIFYNCGSNISVAYLPSELDDDRLYTLDYMCDWLADVQYMEVLKLGEGVRRKFVLGENVMNRFSDEVIQSYYEVKSKGRR